MCLFCIWEKTQWCRFSAQFAIFPIIFMVYNAIDSRQQPILSYNFEVGDEARAFGFLSGIGDSCDLRTLYSWFYSDIQSSIVAMFIDRSIRIRYCSKLRIEFVSLDLFSVGISVHRLFSVSVCVRNGGYGVKSGSVHGYLPSRLPTA